MQFIIVRFIPMPYTIHADTRKDANGDYNVYLNSLISSEAQEEAFLHELEHIRRGHFYQHDRPIEEMEAEAKAHGEAKEDPFREMAHAGFTFLY